MKKSVLIAVLFAFGTAIPAFAADDMMKCDDASMTKMKTDVMGMKDGENKTMAMNEMKMAEDMMMKKDMQGCMKHMNDAMMQMKK